MDLYWLIPAFFAIALLYASAGFGGGSSYLALLALSGLPTAAMRPIALVCNLMVTGGSTFSFARAGVTPWRRAIPLVVASMPAAFLGGRVQLPRQEYLLLLGGLLLLAGLLMLIGKSSSVTDEKKAGRRGAGMIAVTIGVIVGFISGVVGIGGGIFLSPILFLSRWADARAIAATTSLFIALNSLAGLAGQLSVGVEWHFGLTAILMLAVAAGGWLGTRLTLQRFAPSTIRNVAAILILLVGVRLVWSNWLMQL
ncbi:MAG: sulfite exporter TauE/SafE family protein [Lewinella sp.]